MHIEFIIRSQHTFQNQFYLNNPIENFDQIILDFPVINFIVYPVQILLHLVKAANIVIWKLATEIKHCIVNFGLNKITL